jgi:hypothetical protein
VLPVGSGKSEARFMNDPEQIEAWFEKNDDEYMRFERIPVGDRLYVSSGLNGLLKIAQLLKNPEKFTIQPAHDALVIADLDDLVDLTEEDVIYILRCGMHYDSQVECIVDFT